MNVAHFRQWVQQTATQEDVENMRTAGMVTLSCNEILRIPPKWLMLEHSGSLVSAGQAISWIAPYPGAVENVGHLRRLIPETAAGALLKLRTLLDIIIAALLSNSS